MKALTSVFSVLWVGWAAATATYRPGWPSSVVFAFVLSGYLFNEWIRKERQAQLDALEAKHRKELEAMHANLREVAGKVNSLANQAAFTVRK